nr:hypothetical protein FA04_29060 [Ensifer adhaerens]
MVMLKAVQDCLRSVVEVLAHVLAPQGYGDRKRGVDRLLWDLDEIASVLAPLLVGAGQRTGLPPAPVQFPAARRIRKKEFHQAASSRLAPRSNISFALSTHARRRSLFEILISGQGFLLCLP